MQDDDGGGWSVAAHLNKIVTVSTEMGTTVSHNEGSSVAWSSKLESSVDVFDDLANIRNLMNVDDLSIELYLSVLTHRHDPKGVHPIVIVNEIGLVIVLEFQVEHMAMDKLVYSLVDCCVGQFVAAGRQAFHLNDVFLRSVCWADEHFSCH